MKSTKSIFLIIFLIALLCILFAYAIAKKSAESKLEITTKTQLLQTISKLQIILERHSYLPSLLSNDNEIVTFLKTDKTGSNYQKKQQKLNSSLEYTNSISGAATIFLMNPKGTVVSSSNWAEKESFIGQDFSSWPYFQQASQNSLGRYYSPQIEENERYYYFARSVQSNNTIIGIIVVQVPLSDIAFDWTLSDIDFVVTDNDGMVFLSSNKSWDLNILSGLDLSLSDTRKYYRNDKLQLLNKEKIDLTYEGFQRVTLLDEEYQMLSQKVELAGWSVRVLSKYSIAQKEISRNLSLSSILIFLVTVLAGLILKIQNQRKSFRRQTREELENKVRERTQALKQSQEDLIQAAKMAALGQLSAGITHEINNPLTAIRAYADNANQFLEKDRLDMVKSNLGEITKLTENMAAITNQLKSFARKSKGETIPVNLSKAVNNALSIIHPKVISTGTVITFNDNAKSKEVLADDIWLSQILVNLISNAISATNSNSQRNVWIDIDEITSETKKHMWCIKIRDNGTGIEESNLPRIFEPFFTTKSTAKGLGLGLSISFNLAKEMNGSLDARNREDGGALFTLCLPSTSSA